MKKEGFREKEETLKKKIEEIVKREGINRNERRKREGRNKKRRKREGMKKNEIEKRRRNEKEEKR